MALVNTSLSFEILDTFSCKTMAIADTSFYAEGMTITGNVLQVELPDREQVIELNYVEGGVTILNSNSLKYTKVTEYDDLIDLPDGFYTAKISVCPYNQYKFERSWYRTCQLECKLGQAILKMGINSCGNCFSNVKMQQLQLADFYIKAIHANVVDANVNAANTLYTKANTIIDDILNCDCD